MFQHLDWYVFYVKTFQEEMIFHTANEGDDLDGREDEPEALEPTKRARAQLTFDFAKEKSFKIEESKKYFCYIYSLLCL